MWYPAQVQAADGRHRAFLLGAPTVYGGGDTRATAVAALREEVARRFDRGELVWVNVPAPGEPAPPQPYTEADAEAVEDMIAETYRRRDAEKAAEFPG